MNPYFCSFKIINKYILILLKEKEHTLVIREHLLLVAIQGHQMQGVWVELVTSHFFLCPPCHTNRGILCLTQPIFNYVSHLVEKERYKSLCSLFPFFFYFRTCFIVPILSNFSYILFIPVFFFSLFFSSIFLLPHLQLYHH